MTQAATNNAKVLYQLDISKECVEKAESIYNLGNDLSEVLANPVISVEQKHGILEDVFSKDEFPVLFINFLKVMCDHGDIDELQDIFRAYYEYWDIKNNILRVNCVYHKEPDKETMSDIKAYLGKKYPEKELIFSTIIDSKILGGIVVKVGNEEYDWSYEGRLRQLERILTGR